MAAPAWVTTAASGPTASNSVAATVPTGVAANDILLAFLIILSTSTVVVTPPTGFTQQGTTVTSSTSNGAMQSSLWWKRATGSDSGTYTFGLDNTYTWVIDVMRYSGAITTGDPIDVATSGGTNGALSSTTPALSLTTNGPNRLLVWFANCFGTNASLITVPSGYTTSEWSGSRSKVNDTTLSSAGSTGTVQGSTSLSGGDGFTSWLVALKPPASGSPSSANRFFLTL